MFSTIEAGGKRDRRIRSHQAAGPSRCPARLDLLQDHNQNIPGLRALYIKRTGLRIGPFSYLAPFASHHLNPNAEGDFFVRSSISRGSTGYDYNDEAGMPYAYYFSRTYTFLHDLLTEEEREQCRRAMKVRGG